MSEWNLNAAGKKQVSIYSINGLQNERQLKKYVAASSRPFVLVSERELSVLRRGLTKDGWKRALYLQPGDKNVLHPYAGVSFLSAANQWLDSEIQIPDFCSNIENVQSNSGARLGADENNAPDAEIKCQDCGSLLPEDENNRAVSCLQHRCLASAVLYLSIVYAIEKDHTYADKAAEILIKYAQAISERSCDSADGIGIMSDVADEAKWIVPIAQAYDILYYSHSISDENRYLIEKNLFYPLAKKLENADLQGSAAAWKASAIGVIGLSVKNADFVRYSLEEIGDLIANYLGDDGLWPGSVHRHHFSALSAFVHMSEACYRAGIDIYNWQVGENKSIKQMFLSPLLYMLPSFRIPSINEGVYNSFLPLSLYEIAHRRWDDPIFAWALKRGYKPIDSSECADMREHADEFLRRSFYSFLFGRDLPGRSGVPTIGNQNFPNFGVCCMRNSDGTVVTFDYGPNGKRGHRDKMSFTLYANGELLVPDYGSPYLNGDNDGWYEESLSHNTVVVDGKSQVPESSYCLKKRYAGTVAQFVEGVSSDIYAGVSHRRRILLFGNACIVIDDLSSDEEHCYDWLLHCVGDYEAADPSGNISYNSIDYDKVKFEHLLKDKDSILMKWACVDSDLNLGLWNVAQDGDVYIGKCPGETFSSSASFFMSRQHGKDSTFIAALASLSKGENVAMSLNGPILALDSNVYKDYIYIKSDGFNYDLANISTDAEIAAVRTLGNEIVGIAVINGSWISWNGDLLLESSSEANCIEVSYEERNPTIKFCGESAVSVKLKTAARAMRVNGFRTSASTLNGQAVLRVTSEMLQSDLNISRH